MCMNASPEFAQAVALAREVGKEERTFRLWLRHPFRGIRPRRARDTAGSRGSATEEGDAIGNLCEPCASALANPNV